MRRWNWTLTTSPSSLDVALFPKHVCAVSGENGARGVICLMRLRWKPKLTSDTVWPRSRSWRAHTYIWRSHVCELARFEGNNSPSRLYQRRDCCFWDCSGPPETLLLPRSSPEKGAVFRHWQHLDYAETWRPPIATGNFLKRTKDSVIGPLKTTMAYNSMTAAPQFNRFTDCCKRFSRTPSCLWMDWKKPTTWKSFSKFFKCTNY